MIKVKALRAHNNTYGDKVAKEPGDEYALPEAAADTLAGIGLVEIVKDAPAAKAKAEK